MTTRRNLICAVLALYLSLNAATQQISGSVRGAVVDPSGLSVPGATVSAKQTETGLTRSATTDRSGGYVLLELSNWSLSTAGRSAGNHRLLR